MRLGDSSEPTALAALAPPEVQVAARVDEPPTTPCFAAVLGDEPVGGCTNVQTFQ